MKPESVLEAIAEIERITADNVMMAEALNKIRRRGIAEDGVRDVTRVLANMATEALWRRSLSPNEKGQPRL